MFLFRSESDSAEESDEPEPRRYWGRLREMVGKVVCFQQDDRSANTVEPQLSSTLLSKLLSCPPILGEQYKLIANIHTFIFNSHFFSFQVFIKQSSVWVNCGWSKYIVKYLKPSNQHLICWEMIDCVAEKRPWQCQDWCHSQMLMKQNSGPKTIF